MAKRMARKPKAITSVADLTPDPRNARRHGKRNIEALTASLQEVGAARSIVVDEAGVVLAGNATLESAKAAGIKRVQVVDVAGDTLVAVRRSGLTAREKVRLALADNRVAELAEGWDEDLLKELRDDGVLDGLWTEDELLDLFGGPADGQAGKTDPDAVPETRETNVVPGDIYQLGDHRLACGDATDPDQVTRLLAGDRIDAVVTSPPYNVNIKYRSHKDRAARDVYLKFIGDTARAFVPHMAPGRFVAWNIGVSPDTYPAHQVVTLEGCGLAFYRQIVWKKAGVAYPIFPSTLRTRRTRHYKPNYTHELIQVFETAEDGEPVMVDCTLCAGSGQMALREIPSAAGHDMVYLLTAGLEPELGGESKPDIRYANDVWTIAQMQATKGLRTVGERSSGLERKGKGSHRVKEHPAAFPVELPRVVLSFLTAAGERVYEPFGGSGSTVIACEQLGRQARAMELDPVYCQLQIDRWQEFTGKKATRVEKGRR